MGITINSSGVSITKIALKPQIGSVVNGGFIGDTATFSAELYPTGNNNLLAGSGSAIVQITTDTTISIIYQIIGTAGERFNYSGFLGAVRVA